jgi:hypothetical protein
MDQEGSEDEDEAVHASSKLRRVSEDAGTSDAKGGAVVAVEVVRPDLNVVVQSGEAVDKVLQLWEQKTAWNKARKGAAVRNVDVINAIIRMAEEDPDVSESLATLTLGMKDMLARVSASSTEHAMKKQLKANYDGCRKKLNAYFELVQRGVVKNVGGRTSYLSAESITQFKLFAEEMHLVGTPVTKEELIESVDTFIQRNVHVTVTRETINTYIDKMDLEFKDFYVQSDWNKYMWEDDDVYIDAYKALKDGQFDGQEKRFTMSDAWIKQAAIFIAKMSLSLSEACSPRRIKKAWLKTAQHPLNMLSMFNICSSWKGFSDNMKKRIFLRFPALVARQRVQGRLLDEQMAFLPKILGSSRKSRNARDTMPLYMQFAIEMTHTAIKKLYIDRSEERKLHADAAAARKLKREENQDMRLAEFEKVLACARTQATQNEATDVLTPPIVCVYCSEITREAYKTAFLDERLTRLACDAEGDPIAEAKEGDRSVAGRLFPKAKFVLDTIFKTCIYCKTYIQCPYCRSEPNYITKRAKDSADHRRACKEEHKQAELRALERSMSSVVCE